MERRQCPIGLFLACLGLLLALGPAWGAVGRPGANDPYEGTTTLLRHDSILALAEEAGSGPAFRFSLIAPDEVLSDDRPLKAEGTARLYGGDLPLKYGVAAARDEENAPYLIESLSRLEERSGGFDGKVVIRVRPVDREASSLLGGAEDLEFSFPDVVDAVDGRVVLTNDWDRDGSDDAIVLAVPPKANYTGPISVLAVRNVASEKERTSPPVVTLGDDVLYRADILTGLRAAQGDVDGDGTKEIVLFYVSGDFVSGHLRLALLKVEPEETASGAWSRPVRVMGTVALPLAGGRNIFTDSKAQVLDVAMGDVDGDGQDEIFWSAYSHDDGDGLYGLRWGLYRIVNGAFSRMDAGEKPLYGTGSIFESNADVAHRCLTADIDGDGKEELFLLYTDFEGALRLASASYREKGTSVTTLKLRDGEIGQIDLATGNLTGEIRPGAIDDNGAHLAASWVEGGNQVIRTFFWDGDRELLQAGRGTEIVGGGAAELLVGDFTRSGLVLGEPVHIVVEDHVTPVVVMQEPPKHLDYTLTTGSSTYGALNLSRLAAFRTDFYSGQSSEKGLTASQSTQISTALSAGATVSQGYKLKGPAGFDVSLQVEGKIQKSWATKDESYGASYRSTSDRVAASTNRDDYVAYRLRTLDIWRYPLLGQKGQVNGEQVWISAMIPAPSRIVNFAGASLPWFQPPWCNGNLLSYPREASQLEDYAAEDRIGEGQDFLVGPNATQWTVSWNDKIRREKTHTETVTHKKEVASSLQGKYSYFGYKGGVKVEGRATWDDAGMKASSESSSFGTETGFSMLAPASFPQVNNSNAYFVSPFVYLTPAKAMKVSYTADIPEGNRQWWYDRYGRWPDPALNLPNLWVASGSDGWVWDENETSNPNARRIRGLFVYDGDGNPAGMALSESRPVTLRCRVHNFAISVPGGRDTTARDVTVRFEQARFHPDRHEEDSRELIGEVTLPAIAAWNDGRNWAWADMAWDVTALEAGTYRIHVTVDPHGTVTELPHHGLGETCDNNRGWFQLFVAETPSQLRAERSEETEKRVELHELDGRLEIARAGANRWRIGADIANGGNRSATDVFVSFFEGTDTAGVPFDQRYIEGILPGRHVPLEVEYSGDGGGTGQVTLLIHYKLDETESADNVIAAALEPSDGGCSSGPGRIGSVLLLAPLFLARRCLVKTSRP